MDRARRGRKDWYCYATQLLWLASIYLFTGTIGITNYAADALGDVVFVELPEVGMEVKKGDTIGAVESVKSASDIMTPVSGTVVEANSLLEEKPATINKGPETEGWLAKIEVTDATELDALMTAEQYDNFEKES
jgi:glycine cleavage system H protein